MDHWKLDPKVAKDSRNYHITACKSIEFRRSFFKDKPDKSSGTCIEDFLPLQDPENRLEITCSNFISGTIPQTNNYPFDIIWRGPLKQVTQYLHSCIV